MTIPKLLLASGLLGLGLAGQPPRPSTYSVTELFYDAYYGVDKPANWTLYRDGSRLLIEKQNTPGQQRKYHVRHLYNLETHSEIFWDVDYPGGCGTTVFSDDEIKTGNPFEALEPWQLKNAKEIGAETLHGVATKVYQVDLHLKAWIEPESGAIMKAEAIVEGKVETPLEVTKLTLAKPRAESFVVPAACIATLKTAPKPPARSAAM